MTVVPMIDGAAVAAVLDYPAVIASLREAYREGCEVNEVFRLDLASASGALNSFLLRPAWQRDRHIGVKLVSVFPDNATRGLASVLGLYALFDGATGAPLACLDGTVLTLWKTAANSALAADYLAREDAASMLMVGAGALAPHLITAHACVRPIRRVAIWNRTPERARALARAGDWGGLEVTATEDLARAVGEADVISCATMARTPLIRGAWLRPGTHLDLVGGFTLAMREADDEAVRRARVYVDTPEGTIAEVGDIAGPIAAGVIAEADIAGDLYRLCRKTCPGRTSATEITLCKNGGGGLQDLATARLVFERTRAG